MEEPAVVNRPPNARNDAARTAENKSVRVSVLKNDSDPNRNNIRITNFSQPKHGKVYKRGDTLVYKPDRNFSGRDAFTYRISDVNGGTDRARVRITVRPAPKPKTQACRPGRDGKTIFGTPGNDMLRGTRGDDRIFGFGGNDRIIGGNGEDQIIGGDGSDIIRGGSCGDTIKANDGNNRVYGEGGGDVVDGGKDRDLIVGGGGEDVFMGNGGRDRLIARDGRKDVVNGGSGRDTCRTDRKDGKAGCP